MKSLVFGVGLLLSAGAASAATMTADFDLRSGGNATNRPSLSYTANGVDLTVSGLVCASGAGPNHASCNGGTYSHPHGPAYDARIDRSSEYGIYFNQPHDSDHAVDGDGSTDEFLKLVFDPIVTLSSIKFSYWDHNDNALVYSRSGNSWSLEEDISSGSNFWYEYDFAEEYTGSMFLVGATGNNDEWKLKSVSVEYAMPSAVPLPAAGWLLMGALAGIGAITRRRSAA